MSQETSRWSDAPTSHRRRTFLLILPVVFLCAAAFADRNNRLGAGIEIMGALDDNPLVNHQGLSPILGRNYSRLAAVYPSLRLQSSTPRSDFTLDYDFGFERYESSLDLQSESHRVNAAYEARISPRWKINVVDAYTRSPDFMGFLAYRGTVITPEGMAFDFTPSALRRNGFHNTAEIGVECATSQHSSLRVLARHAMRDYESSETLDYRLSNYHRYQATAQFDKRLSPHTEWLIGYTGNQYSFERFREARTHDLYLGVERELRPSWKVHLQAGPSYTEPMGKKGSSATTTAPGAHEGDMLLSSYMGYNVDFTVTHSSPSTTVDLFFRHDNGVVGGYGSISANHTAGFNLSRTLGRRLTVAMTAIAYDQHGQLDNPWDSRGLASTLEVDFRMSRYSSLAVGATYQTQESGILYNLDRRRIFLALRFFLPEASPRARTRR